jgi:hypothetical protein
VQGQEENNKKDYREKCFTRTISEILGFRTLSIVLVFKNKLRKHYVSETASVSVLRTEEQEENNKKDYREKCFTRTISEILGFGGF